MKADFLLELKNNLRGDLFTDTLSLGMYATDASVYQIQPVAVALPKDEADVLTAMQIAARHQVAVLPRGSATSLSGQTIAEALVLDFTKYLCNVLEINPVERWARVQPGVTLDQLNDLLKPHRLHFAPDPATANRATFGGMIANNSSGTKSIVYGKTVDHLLELKVALADGTVLNFKELNQDEWEKKAAQPDREGEIYRCFRSLVFENTEEIFARYPKTMRRVQGYNLDEFAGKELWNLSKIICGSEGTLATILEAKVNLEPLPKHRSLVVAHFSDFLEAIRATEPMLEFQPCAVELVDKSVLDMAKENLSTAPLTWFIQPDPANPGEAPAAMLNAEFQGDTLEDCLDRAGRLVEKMRKLGTGYAYPVFTDPGKINDVLTVRKRGLGLVLGVKSEKRFLSFIEDAAIPVPQLADYIAEVLALCKKYETPVSAYAHASVGVIHVKPFLDLRTAEDLAKYKAISQETFELVKKYGGSWSSEHGDGLARSAYLRAFFGDKIYAALRQVKQLFDPENRMNPGKIIEAPPIDSHLRYPPGYHDQSVETFYHYRSDGNFAAAVHLCSGVGECRKLSGGTMCPSFKATLDEEHSTRGRANALRLAIMGTLEGGKNLKNFSPQNSSLAPPSRRLLETLDLCLSCKACKSECPSNVDMARLKSEVLQKHYDAHGTRLRERFVRDSAAMAARFSGRMAPLVNAMQGTQAFKFLLEKVAGVSSKRTLPPFASAPFSRRGDPCGRPGAVKNDLFKTPPDARATARVAPAIVVQDARATPIKVALFADTYLNFHEPNIGVAALRLLQNCGFEVDIAEVGCCQRPKISNGFLRDAKLEGEKTARRLDDLIRQGYAIAVCEPSCASALTDDLPDLLDDETLGLRLQQNIFPIEVLLEKTWAAGQLDCQFTSPASSIFVHGHCHQKALFGTNAMKNILQKVENLQVLEADTGCCGMAGSFGYEKEHVAISEKIGELALFPALRKLSGETQIVANGFSCRHQISDFLGRKAVHWVEIIEAQAASLRENK